MKNYKKFIIQTEPFAADLVSGVLWELNISGIAQEDNSLTVFAEKDSGISKASIESLLSKLIDEKVISSFSVYEKIIEDKNWNEEWEKNRQVVKVSEKIIIKPTFKDYKKRNDEIVITIDPKMSFGTGTHESTKLILLLLEKFDLTGKKILDVGSGTGILSIAAIKLGAKSAVAVDIDEWCYDNCIENCKLNNVSEYVKVIKGNVDDIAQNDFDIVLANIQKNILLEIAAEIKKRVNEKGIIILSGILLKDEDEIIKHFKLYGLEMIEKETMNEWVALVLKATS